MLGYQSTSFHDALYAREMLGVKPAPEYAAWLERMGLMTIEGRLTGDSRRRLATAADRDA
ncbi:MAG: ethanolamine ammonia-lyase subunit EutB [Sphingomicrobium sp.]